MKNIAAIRKSAIILTILAGCALSSPAVTRDEMEQARAISAKLYLRWANNGSGYLDEINPSTISELEKSLHDKEKENLKAFKAIPVPSDYQSWDKAKLVEYWSKTALSSSGLIQDGVTPGSRKNIKAALNKLSVSAPTAKAEEPAPAEAAEPVTLTDSPATPIPAEEAQAIAAAEAEFEAADSAALAEDSLAEEPKSKRSSNTWIYFVALALLIVAVIVLVIYASKSLNAGDTPKSKAAPDAPEPTPRKAAKAEKSRGATLQEPAATATAAAGAADAHEVARLREKYAESLAAKQDEIRSLNRRITDLEEENRRLEETVTRQKQECERLRREAELAVDGIAATRPTPRVDEPSRAAERPAERAAEPRKEIREIYLGRVNANGVFVRADRSFNPGRSIYRLRTTDGFSGTFRVVDDAAVVDATFSHPQDMLGGGCVAMDITDTRGKTEIITESAGTAVFENNCWRVVRKAKIRFE